MVTPHGVERDADFMGHGATIPSRREPQQGGGQSPFLPTLPFFQRSKRREWMSCIVADRRGLEGGAGLGGTRMDAGNQNFGPKRPEVDPAATQHSRLTAARPLPLPASDQWQRPAGGEDEVDRFVDLVLERLERDHAGLAD